LLFAIEEDEGTIYNLLCVALSPVVDNGNDPVGHGEGHDRAWFFDGAGVNIKKIESALVIAGWAKEDPRERAKLHGICYCRFVVGFDVGAKGGNAVLTAA
jgi:hypothetical protein